MKKINIQCYDNGRATLKTKDIHIESENIASVIEVDFSQTEYKNYQKGIDIKSGSYLLRYFLGNDEVVFKELTYENTLPGELVITPFVFDEVTGRKVRYLTDYSVIIRERTSVASQDVPDNFDVILEGIKEFLRETTDKLVVDMEFNKDTNLLSLILENGDEISTIIDIVGGGGGLTPEQEAKLNLIKDNGVGDKYLADDGTYKVVSGGGDGGKDFHRVRIFNENGNLIQTQVVYDGEKISRIELEPNKFLFEYGTENSFSYATKIYEDIDLVLGDMPARYVQTTVEDFDESGNYTGSESYIILPSDKPDGYKIVNPDVIGVATNGDDLTNVSYMFKDNPSLYLELDYLDTSNVTDMSYMFDGSQATTLDLSSFDTSNVTDMSYMFDGSQATTLDLSSFDTSNVTTMSYMFDGSQATTLDLSSFDTSNVTTMWAMFIRSQATTLDLSSFDTSNVTSMRSMFNTSEATTLDLSSFDTSNVTTMEAMFQDSQATTLDLSSFDTSNVTNMSYMFNGSQVTTLDLSNFNTSDVTTMRTMFQNSQATTLDLSSFDTSKVTIMLNMFYGSRATTLDLSSFDTSSVTDMQRMFQNSKATTGYARTQADADKFNNSSGKPSTLTFVVK